MGLKPAGRLWDKLRLSVKVIRPISYHWVVKIKTGTVIHNKVVLLVTQD